MLVNCAGTAMAGKFEDMEVDRFKVGNHDTTVVLFVLRSSHCLYFTPRS